MKCLNCKNEISENSIYCNICGKPTSMVPDYSIYDDDDLNVLLEGAEIERAKQTQEDAEELRKKEEEQKRLAEQKRIAMQQKKEELRQQRLLEKKKKQRMQITISLVILVSVLIIIGGVYVKYAIDERNANSLEYQVEQAEKAIKNGDWDEAVEYYKKAIALDSKNVSVRVDLAKLYFDGDDDENAVKLLLDTINQDKSAYDAYKTLIGYYEEQNDIGAILELTDGISDSRVENLFKNYIVEAPTIQLEGGTFDKAITIRINANMSSSIYYTIDGSDPVSKGILYTSPIKIEKKGKYTLKVVAKNEKGIYSDMVSEKYEIVVNAPDDPMVSLTETGETVQGGTFEKETYLSIYIPSGCNVYYTWGNTDPTAEDGTLYTEPILVPEGHNILSVVVIDLENDIQSSIFRGSFDYYPAEEDE